MYQILCVPTYLKKKLYTYALWDVQCMIVFTRNFIPTSMAGYDPISFQSRSVVSFRPVLNALVYPWLTVIITSLMMTVAMGHI